MKRIFAIIILLTAVITTAVAQKRNIHVFAHRGCWSKSAAKEFVIPENSVAAVAEAKRRGYEGIELDEMQCTAVVEAARNGVLVITGGPGTGKTTTINTIIRYFELEGYDIFLAAPTGRAAKRMSETTGFEARTIHRMLELNGGVDGGAGFERNERNPLETDVIIVDEMSMVDVQLLHSLLQAVPQRRRLTGKPAARSVSYSFPLTVNINT